MVTGEVLLEFTLVDPAAPNASASAILHRLVRVSTQIDPQDDDELPSQTETPIPLMQTTSLDDEDNDSDSGLSESGIDTDTGLDTDDPTRQETPEKRRRRLKLKRLRRRAKRQAYKFSGGTSDLHGVLFLEITKVTDLPPERNSKSPFLEASIAY